MVTPNNRLSGMLSRKDTKFLVKIQELDEFIEVQLSAATDNLVERTHEAILIKESDLTFPQIESFSDIYDRISFDGMKKAIREYAERKNADYISISVKLPPLKQLPEEFPARLSLRPYNKK